MSVASWLVCERQDPLFKLPGEFWGDRLWGGGAAREAPLCVPPLAGWSSLLSEPRAAPCPGGGGGMREEEPSTPFQPPALVEARGEDVRGGSR